MRFESSPSEACAAGATSTRRPTRAALTSPAPRSNGAPLLGAGDQRRLLAHLLAELLGPLLQVPLALAQRLAAIALGLRHGLLGPRHQLLEVALDLLGQLRRLAHVAGVLIGLRRGRLPHG